MTSAKKTVVKAVSDSRHNAPLSAVGESSTPDSGIDCDYAYFRDVDQALVMREFILEIRSVSGVLRSPVSNSFIVPGPIEMYSARHKSNCLLFFGFPQFELARRLSRRTHLSSDWLVLGDSVAQHGYGRCAQGEIENLTWAGPTVQKGLPHGASITSAREFIGLIKRWFVPPTLLWSFGKIRDENWYQEITAHLKAESEDYVSDVCGVIVQPRQLAWRFRGTWKPEQVAAMQSAVGE